MSNGVLKDFAEAEKNATDDVESFELHQCFHLFPTCPTDHDNHSGAKSPVELDDQESDNLDILKITAIPLSLKITSTPCIFIPLQQSLTSNRHLWTSMHKKRKCLNHDSTILGTCDAFTGNEETKIDKLSIARLGRWTPIAFSVHSREYYFLSSLITANAIMENKDAGIALSPKKQPPDKPRPLSYSEHGRRTRHTLFSQPFADVETNPIWWRSVAPHSLGFDLTPSKMSLSDFKTSARNAIPHSCSLSLIFHRDGNRMIAEIVFTSTEDCVLFSN